MLSREKVPPRIQLGRKIVPLSFGCSLFHWPICTHECGSSLLPFYISYLRTTRWLKFIGINRTVPREWKMKSYRKKERNSRESSSRWKMMILMKKKKKNCWLPFLRSSLYENRSRKRYVGWGGELRKKTWFFNLPVARTWLHVCKAGVRRVHSRWKLGEYDVRTSYSVESLYRN